ncbi:cytochrome PufQ [Lutimaribacter sp. EGI FJ00015]|uniref:Cytochrome PufQ n=1 Tax=Lutimaribacter degradans TaxID=2945989 RepID=A0ACC5ZW24_9RHOB|nr:cytochrome PufQ [Lutimaribacter sp. EGI FJ00013]MCM2562040.1 cytochrome PufQ [Lutimaribacter sp. EGI FJ00013]MCO0612928.1 cytochrome PufQ [Lutimaribacter sp. EGI FJ00015]MCO0635872.1 cytochrome PufQ [Lutimaribacter sp. EGI FJ00014]
MTDVTSKLPTRPSRCISRRSAEFRVFFALFFVVAIPFATISWVRAVARERTLITRGPLARAWAEADRITPIVFSV